MIDTVACPLCGSRFDPSAEVACANCPMSGACTLACCPNCGYTTVDVASSRSASLLGRLLPSRRERVVAATLDLATIGGDVRIAGFDAAMSTGHRELLRTYGIEPGRMVRIEQHSPVTVVHVDETEVALESELARLIYVGSVR